MLNWSNQFNTFCFLDNHQYQIQPHTHECLLAAGVRSKQSFTPSQSSIAAIQEYLDLKKSRWIFGHLNYDLKNELEDLQSNLPDQIGFPDFFFFEPLVIVRLTEHSIDITADDPGKIFEQINSSPVLGFKRINETPIAITSRIDREHYLDIVKKLQQHILRGDCYEINFCQEFFAENIRIDPLYVYDQLSLISPNPFSALYRQENKWLICASPERFIKKHRRRVISQPIKGTSPRVPGNKEEDEFQKHDLYVSKKDRSENVMIVDLVRNDLAKVCEEGTVQVDELYGIYSFPQVHQMISTISGELKPDTTFTDIIRACFPMGSMTGAPKKKVMQLIEQYEKTKRGIFSGAIGYIDPSGDFDFNVVIRSILYNEDNLYLSYLTGSGITFYSDPQKEWEECLWKASAIQQVLK